MSLTSPGIILDREEEEIYEILIGAQDLNGGGQGKMSIGNALLGSNLNLLVADRFYDDIYSVPIYNQTKDVRVERSLSTLIYIYLSVFFFFFSDYS